MLIQLFKSIVMHPELWEKYGIVPCPQTRQNDSGKKAVR